MSPEKNEKNLRSLLTGLARLLERGPLPALAVFAALVGLSAWGALHLKVNTNQIELLPQDLRAVKEAHRIREMVGGFGFLMLALEGEDDQHLKDVSDDLAERLKKMPEVRTVSHKLDISFVRDRVGLYIATPDLKEAHRRIKAKVKDVVQRNNPFHITLRETKPVELDLQDIVDKYKEVGKKRIADDYNITPDRKMILLLVKPMGNSTDLEFTRKLLSKIEALIADYNRANTRKAVLKERYTGLAPGATVTYGYTGGYKLNLDDSESIIQSLIPTSAISVAGILLLLLLFLRRVVLVLALRVSLVSGVVMTFGFCYVAVGELNSITAILAGILMGQGIDFGIQFIYRVREEFSRSGVLSDAVQTALSRLGVAALTTALSTAAAFFALTISDFKGFRDFGLMAGGGTIIIACTMLLLTAVQLHLLYRLLPDFMDRRLRLSAAQLSKDEARRSGAPFPFVRALLWGGALLTAAMLVGATGRPAAVTGRLPERLRHGVRFDYDSRALMVKDRPSILLQQEIKERYKISADPVAVYTRTLEEARLLYQAMRDPRSEKFGVVDPERFSTVDAVVSLWLFVPDTAQQQANVKILQEMKDDFEPITPGMLEEKWREHYKTFFHLLSAKPFTIKDVPQIHLAQFTERPGSKVKGFLTFIYPKVALWDSRDLMAFSDQVSEIEAGGKKFYATGMAILFARLAGIVLHDGRVFTLLAAGAIVLILLLSLRSFWAALVALVPLVVGISWMLGLMALLGQRINFMNVVVFPVVLGYGMGNGIYIFHRFKESRSVRVALGQTGRAVLASCVTTLVGWSSLLTANHLGLESMGMLSSLGIGCVLVTSLLIFPALLQLLERWFTSRWSPGA